MIETGKETTKLLREIVRKTKWSLRKIAGKLDINHSTIWQISKGRVDNPKQESMDKIEALRAEVEEL